MECLDDSNLPAGRRITTAAVLLVALLLLQLRGFLPGASPSGARHTAKYLPVLHNGAMMFNESAPFRACGSSQAGHSSSSSSWSPAASVPDIVSAGLTRRPNRGKLIVFEFD